MMHWEQQEEETDPEDPENEVDLLGTETLEMYGLGSLKKGEYKRGKFYREKFCNHGHHHHLG